MMFQNKLRGLTIDFSQQKDKIIGANFGMHGKSIAAEKIGQKSYDDMLDFWAGMQNFMAPLEDGYIKKADPANMGNAGRACDVLARKAVNRAAASVMMKQASGKKLIKPDLKEKADPYDMALAYTVDSYIKRLNGAENVEGIKALGEAINLSFTDGTVKREAEKLSKNVIFKELIKTNRTHFSKAWNEIQKKTDATIANMKDILKSMSTDEKDVTKYILTGNPDGNAVISKGPEAIKKQYERLGDFIAMQILTDPANRLIVQAIEAGRLDFNEVVNSTTKSLKKNKALEGKDFNIGALRDSITSGNLKRIAKEDVMKDAKRKAKEYAPGQKREAPQRGR